MWMESWVAVAAGAGLAVASLSHCALMCGPLSVHAAAMGGVRGYLLGRLAGYTLAGLVAGSLGQALGQLGPARWVEAALSWAFALSLATLAVRALRARRATDLVQLSKKPGRTPSLLARVMRDPLLLGLGTTLLPCGVLLTALLAAAAQGSPVLGALTMGAFSVVSGGALLGFSQLAQRLVSTRHGHLWLSAVLALGALLFLVRPLSALGSPGPACHAHAQPGGTP